MNKFTLLPTTLALLIVTPPTSADITDRPAVQSFLQEMRSRHGFATADLQDVFRQVEFQPKIIESISRPAEAKPWRDYRKIFMTEARIQSGLSFWAANQAALEKARLRFGVPPEMIIGILGVETTFGEKTGNYRVIDALSTLAFDYPRRAEFFRKELVQFLVLCRDEAIDATVPKGSYAGAMGIPQFMPSSYRQYAADLNGDGKRNLWTDPEDAIGSVARYFSANGWLTGGAVAFPAEPEQGAADTYAKRDGKPNHSIAELRRAGIGLSADLPGSTRAGLLELDGEAGSEYWITLHNFQVIMRYNHSPLYAMAALQLGAEIQKRRDASKFSR